MNEDIPSSVRIRTAGDNEYRYHAIQEVSDFYGVNRSDSVAYACDNVVGLVSAIESILQRDDLTPKQKKEIAQECSGRGISFDYEETTSVNKG